LFELKEFNYAVNEGVNLSLDIAATFGIENHSANIVQSDCGTRKKVTLDVLTECIYLFAAVTTEE
jgi:hypothetical protein